MNRVASGGELSRFMLALRVVAHQSTSVTTMIFDEVDSGVGGATAEAVVRGGEAILAKINENERAVEAMAISAQAAESPKPAIGAHNAPDLKSVK